MTDYASNTKFLLDAVRAKDAAKVELLIPVSYSMRHMDLSWALIHAIENNDVACVRLLAPAGQYIEISHSLSHQTSVDILQAVVPWCDDENRFNFLLSLIQEGTVGQVATVAQYCDCTQQYSLALQMAVIEERDDLVDVLYPLSDIQAAMSGLEFIGSTCKAFVRLVERIDNEKLHQRLMDNIPDSARTTVARKI